MNDIELDKWLIEQNGEWWYIDETADLCGPYQTKEKARTDLIAYLDWLEKH